MKTKTGTIILVLVAAIVLLAYYLFLRTMPETGKELKLERETEVSVPPSATGKLEDAVSALLQELKDENTLIAQENDDGFLGTNDSQEIGDFGQSVNENEY